MNKATRYQVIDGTKVHAVKAGDDFRWPRLWVPQETTRINTFTSDDLVHEALTHYVFRLKKNPQGWAYLVVAKQSAPMIA